MPRFLLPAIKRCFALSVCLLALMFTFVFTPQAVSAENLTGGLIEVWDSRSGDLHDMTLEVAAMLKQAEHIAGPLAEAVQEARTDFARLASLFQASRGHPTEQLTLLQQMHVLRINLSNNVRPLREIADSVAQRLEEVTLLQNDMAELLKENAASGVNLQSGQGDEAKSLVTYNRSLSESRRALQAASARMEAMLAPAEMTMSRISQSISDIEKSTYEVWRKYYLTPSANSMGALAAIPSTLSDWATSMYSRLSFAYPQSGAEWLGAAIRFAVAGVIILILGVLANKVSAHFPIRLQRAFRKVRGRPWIFLVLGLATLAASINALGGLYFGFVLLGALLLVDGMAGVSWYLRVAVVEELEGRPAPMQQFYPAAVAGVLMLFSDLPTQFLGLVWAVVMAVFLAYITKRARKNPDAPALPLLERFSYFCAVFFGLASLVLSLIGYARLSILLYMGMFAFINVLTLGSALMELTVIFMNRKFEAEKMPMRNAIAQGIAVPLALAFSLVCTLPWLVAVPGGRYVAMNIISAGYTVGDASFDFSKLIFIVVLFFLFRAFVSLGQTSLKHLPDKMPHVERGVVQPLAGLLTYGLWILFILVVLGMLGVNFTSLAVVAGGLSVGIGFGMQNIFNNLISGLMLIFGRTLLVGDFVDIGNFSGTVKAITIRSTVLETGDRSLVYIPNSSLMSSPFTNWTRNGRMVRRSVSVGVAYGSDTEQVIKVLLDSARAQEHVLDNPAPFVVFSNFAESSLDFILYLYIDDISNGLGTLTAVRAAINKAFEDKGINIPFPQMTLHMNRPSDADDNTEKL